MISNREFLTRTENLIGVENMNKLIGSTIGVLGLGGVGSYAFEVLVRSGVGKIIVVDYDKIEISNINRQILATTRTVGNYKVDEAISRGREISPECEIIGRIERITQDNVDKLSLEQCDYILDCIDDIPAKVEMIKYAKDMDIPIISAMGGGRKLQPDQFVVTDLYSTHMCPLAKKMRRLLKREGITNLKVVYSPEKPKDIKNGVITSIASVPSVIGIIMAGEVINDLIE